MTHVFFDPESVDWSSFFTSQHGRGQKQYFVGSKYQRGFGFLGNVARFLTPIARNIASSAGHEGLAAGQRVLSDIAQGRDLRDAVREHSRQGLTNLTDKLQQCGKGKRSLITNKNRKQVYDQLSFI